MNTTRKQLRKIYDRTSGYCHICHKKLAFKNYAKFGEKACWEIEHSIPKAQGGTDHRNNLYPACIVCNRKKRDASNYLARKEHGKSKAPLSLRGRQDAKLRNGAIGTIVGGMVGRIALGPLGMIGGALLGAYTLYKRNPDK